MNMIISYLHLDWLFYSLFVGGTALAFVWNG